MTPAIPTMLVYAPLSTSSPHPARPPSAVQVALYCALALGLLVLVALILTLLRRLHIRRDRARSREHIKAAMIAAVAAKDAVWRSRETISEAGDASAPGTTMCCYRRRDEEQAVEQSRELPVLPSLRGSCRGRQQKRESVAGVRLVENVFEDPLEEVGNGDVDEEICAGQNDDLASYTTENHVEFDHSTVHQTPQRCISVKRPAACITTPARDEGPESSLQKEPTQITPKIPISRTLTKSDDMFQRRNKAKSMELLHLKSRLAYPPAVHSARSRFEKVQTPQVTNESKRYLPVDTKFGGRIAMRMLVDALEGRDRSWQTLQDDTDDIGSSPFGNHAAPDRVSRPAKALDEVPKAEEQDEWQEARRVVNRPASQITLVEPQHSVIEEDWEDISEVSTLATSASNDSLCALPTRAREL